MPVFVASVQRAAASAAAAGPKDGVPGRAAAVAPVGRAAVASAAAPAEAVDGAAAAAAGEEAAPGRHAGGATAGGRAGSEVRDGTLPGTCDSAGFQMAR